MTVRDIVEEWLIENGYDGLWHDDCGCGLDDFMPCNGERCVAECEPGYKRKRACPPGGDYDLIIGPGV